MHFCYETSKSASLLQNLASVPWLSVNAVCFLYLHMSQMNSMMREELTSTLLPQIRTMQLSGALLSLCFFVCEHVCLCHTAAAFRRMPSVTRGWSHWRKPYRQTRLSGHCCEYESVSICPSIHLLTASLKPGSTGHKGGLGWDVLYKMGEIEMPVWTVAGNTLFSVCVLTLTR